MVRRHLRRCGGNALACVIALVAAGCQSTGPNATGAMAERPPASAQPHPLLQNVPRPVFFRMVPERSVARQSGRIRVLNCEFVGSAHPDAVVDFYKNHMPAAGFTLRQSRFMNGAYILNFESENEECNVKVQGQGKQTVFVIDIGPLPTGPAETPERPPVRRPSGQ